MKIIRETELSQHDLNSIHDGIIGIFGIEATDKQIGKLLTLCPNWDGIMDTLGEEQIMDAICLHFIGMKVPMYGSSDEYKNKFWKEAENIKEEVEKFIKE